MHLKRPFVIQLLTLVVVAARLGAAEPVPRVSCGHLDHLVAFPAKTALVRTVDVWLPPGFSPTQRYPVLYAHDGQMLFDASSSWNHQSWHLDDVLGRLIAQGKVPPMIVVGIYNTSASRHAEYFPEKALPFIPEPMRTEFISKALGGHARADEYLGFIVRELKPEIDRRYPTLPDKAHTAIMGSSMGGIVSLYAICEYPDVFGSAACLSTHWPGIFKPNASIPLAELEYLSLHIPSPGDHRIYMDHGTRDLDAMYGPHQDEADRLFADRGYGAATFTSRVFTGAGHTENDWASRVDQPLLFLFGSR